MGGSSATIRAPRTAPGRFRAALGASTGTKTRCLRPYRPSPIIFRPAMGFVRWEQFSRQHLLWGVGSTVQCQELTPSVLDGVSWISAHTTSPSTQIVTVSGLN